MFVVQASQRKPNALQMEHDIQVSFQNCMLLGVVLDENGII